MLKAFFSPRGRRPRLSYWRAAALIPLFGILGLIVTMILFRLVVRVLMGAHTGSVSTSAFAVLAAFFLAVWAGFAVAIQRLHDRDRSGWWVLIALVPIIGSIWYLFWNGLRPGTPGPNRFGPDPRAGDAALIEVFGDGPVSWRRARKPIVSTIVAWTLLLAILFANALLLFQNPARRLPPPAAEPPRPIER